MRHSIPLLSLACLILFVVHRVRGNSSGAPEESCASLTVTHVHLDQPVPGTECGPPCLSHQLRLMGSSADNFTYNCNQTYQLQLTLDRAVGGNPQESLNGYMVAPREDTGAPLDGNVSYVGSWELGTDMKLICDGQAVTQSRVLIDTVAVNMIWKAPTKGLQNVAFWFVVVPSTAFYYLPVKSLTATPNPDTCTCTRTCQNGGMLNEGNCTCNCADGYSGTTCGNCSRTCQNGGMLNEGTCTCNCTDGYNGTTCGRMSAAQTCTTYNGDQCTSVFSTADITGSATTISVADTTINTYFTALSMLSISQACQNYLRIIQCLTVYTPCTGTAWCGSMSPTELTTALSNACGCTGTSCTFTVPTVVNYYQGSSSGGRVSNNMLTCQDISLGNSAGTIKISMMGAVLVATLLSVGLLL